jgi:hypothetical protein
MSALALAWPPESVLASAPEWAMELEPELESAPEWAQASEPELVLVLVREPVSALE